MEAKVVDLRNLKATDLKNNKRVIIPPLQDDEVEIKNNYLKNALNEVFVNYKNDHCDKFGNILENNLNDKQMETMK